MVTFDTGTFNANSLQLAVSTSGTAPMGATGTFILGGPNPDSMATGVLNVANQFFLANRTNTVGGPVTGNFVINGGTANISTDIIDASTTGDRTTTLTLAGGTLNMMGNDIGSAASPLTNVTLLSGTLNNAATVAARTITLGPPRASLCADIYHRQFAGERHSGCLVAGTFTLAIQGGGIRGQAPSPAISSPPADEHRSGSDLAAGTLTFNNSLTLSSNSTAGLRLSENVGSGNDQIQVSGNLPLRVSAPRNRRLGIGPQFGNTYTLFNYAGTLTGNQTNFDIAGPLSQSRSRYGPSDCHHAG